jgi:FAD/FMN-containing dehydrogenase
MDAEEIRPGDPGYDAARTVWNAMVDKRPRLVVRCATVAHVQAAVRRAREDGLEIGVRCGGHSVIGQAVPQDGLMIDLTPMGGVRVDPPARRAFVQGGAMLGALDDAAQVHGLATTAGNVSHTGVGGLTLGGGMGWLAREHGLTCDNVESFEVVTAAGEVVRANREEHPELFWGLRGGGGNFGVVTEFEFRLHPVGTRALVVEHRFPARAAVPAFRAWRDLAASAPRSVTLEAFVDDEGLELGYIHVGDPAEGMAYLPTFASIGTPVATRVEPMSYGELQRMQDTPQGHESRRYWKGNYLRELTDEAIDVILGRGGGSDLMPAVSLQAYGGAIADVPDDETAFSHRDTFVEAVTAARWFDAAEDTERIAATRRCGKAIEAFASGVYVNALSDDGADGVRRAYPPAKLARLTALKDEWDPENVFHLNHNIAPSGRRAHVANPVDRREATATPAEGRS